MNPARYMRTASGYTDDSRLRLTGAGAVIGIMQGRNRGQAGERMDRKEEDYSTPSECEKAPGDGYWEPGKPAILGDGGMRMEDADAEEGASPAEVVVVGPWNGSGNGKTVSSGGQEDISRYGKYGIDWIVISLPGLDCCSRQYRASNSDD